VARQHLNLPHLPRLPRLPKLDAKSSIPLFEPIGSHPLYIDIHTNPNVASSQFVWHDNISIFPIYRAFHDFRKPTAAWRASGKPSNMVDAFEGPGPLCHLITERCIGNYTQFFDFKECYEYMVKLPMCVYIDIYVGMDIYRSAYTYIDMDIYIYIDLLSARSSSTSRSATSTWSHCR